MSIEPEKIQGLTREEWDAMYRPGIHEFAGPRFAFSREGPFIRIAFGSWGGFTDETTRMPVYSYAVTLPDGIAVDLARQILHIYAAPEVAPTPPTEAAEKK